MQIFDIKIEVENRIGNKLSRSMVCHLQITSIPQSHLSSSFYPKQLVLAIMQIKQNILLISTSSESISSVQSYGKIYTGGC